MKDTLKYGINNEKKVAQQLRRAGASVKINPGSRGAEDLVAHFNNKDWLVQVKSGKNAPIKLTSTDKQRLNSKATKNNATPVLATVTNNGIEYRSTRSNRKLTP